jgi:hypothetical protein
MKAAFTKTMAGYIPADHQTIEWDQKVKLGQLVHGEFKKARNGAFHKKMFALFNLAYEYWDPGEVNSKYGTPEKNFDRFREDLTILAGFYNVVIRLDGTTRIEAKSLSYAAMDNDEFEKVYNAVLNQILKRINVLKDMTAEEVNKLVDQVLSFT